MLLMRFMIVQKALSRTTKKVGCQKIMYMILGNLEFDELVSVPDYVREEIEKDNALDMTNNRSLSL